MSSIRAAISASILSKADRLFRNDDAGIFIELLQNARRAGATVVDVRIEPSETSPTMESTVIFCDNGRGIDDFQTLLTLGDSDWGDEIRLEEDPAGMGFFSLCHSTVGVQSGHRRVVLSRDVFLGRVDATVEDTEEMVEGTRLVFTRPSTQQNLHETLKRVSEFGTLQVFVNGDALIRHDFLEGALYREVIDGIEVGFGTSFRWQYGLRDENWNFHGSVINHRVDSIKGLLNRNQLNQWQTDTLRMRFNVLEVGRIKLQLPDRRAIVEDEYLKLFEQRVRAAAYRLIGTFERHVLSFRDWAEARELGVTLTEAAPLLKTWHAEALDDCIDPFFGMVEEHLLSSLDRTLIVAGEIHNQHTLEAALINSSSLGIALYRADRSFEGYSWYDELPVLTRTGVIVDGVPFDGQIHDRAARPENIAVEVCIRQVNRPEETLELPAVLHVVDGDEVSWDYECPQFVAVRNSTWDNEKLNGPFDVVQFLVSATFCSSDDPSADSFDTQLDDYTAHVQREVDSYFRGPRAALMGILLDSLPWEARRYAREMGITDIRFVRGSEGDTEWKVEIHPSEAASPNPLGN